MKRGILLLSILVLAFVPAVASAQGFLGGAIPSLPGLPSLGGFFGSGGGCGACEEPSPISLSGTVAWNYEAIDLNCSTLDYQYAGFGAFKHTYKFNGLQLGLTGVAVSRTGFGVWGNFNILATGSTKDPENYNEGFGAGYFQGTRYWTAKNDTYSFTGVGFYNVFNTACVLGGFRWDHLETTFDRPTWTPGVTSSLGGDEATLTVNVYQPFVGAMVDQGGASRVMRIGFIAWPQVYGNVEYGQTFGALGTGSRLDGMSSKVNEGYFWEIFAEYGLKEQRFLGAAFGLFASWTQYHLKGRLNSDLDQIGAASFGSDRFDISLHRNSWTVGGKLEIPLAIPVPFSF